MLSLLFSAQSSLGVNLPTAQKKETADKAGLMPAALTLASPVGTWVNVNAATQDIVKIVLTNNGGSLGVHAFGACSPTPCDWGLVPGQAYSASVAGGSALAFTANYRFGFKNTVLTGISTAHTSSSMASMSLRTAVVGLRISPKVPFRRSDDS